MSEAADKLNAQALRSDDKTLALVDEVLKRRSLIALGEALLEMCEKSGIPVIAAPAEVAGVVIRIADKLRKNS